MAEKVPGDDGPSLELPSLFGGRRKRAPKKTPAAPGEPPPAQTEEPAATREPVRREPVRASNRVTAEEPVVTGTDQTAVVPVVEPSSSAPAQKKKEPRELPELAAGTAALLIGAAMGLLGCVLTYLGLKGCELVTGTDSCGGPGLLVLVLIVVAMIVLGAVLLRMFKVPEAANLSFLGVSIMLVLALVFLIDHLYAGWMFIAIPVLTALSFSVAAWVTSRYTDDESSQSEYRDEGSFR